MDSTIRAANRIQAIIITIQKDHRSKLNLNWNCQSLRLYGEDSVKRIWTPLRRWHSDIWWTLNHNDNRTFSSSGTKSDDTTKRSSWTGVRMARLKWLDLNSSNSLKQITHSKAATRELHPNVLEVKKRRESPVVEIYGSQWCVPTTLYRKRSPSFFLYLQFGSLKHHQ